MTNKRWVIDELLVFGNKRSITYLLITLTLSALAILIADEAIRRLATVDEEIIHLRNTLNELDQFDHQITIAESSQRGFVLTKNPLYAEPFDEAIKQAEAHIDQLRNMLSEKEGDAEAVSSKNELALLDQIQEDFLSKSTEMAMTIKLVKNDDSKGAKKIVNLNEGLNLMTEILSQSEQLSSMLNTRIKKAMDQRETTSWYARVAAVVAPVALMILVLLVMIQLLKDLHAKTMANEKAEAEKRNYIQDIQQQSELLQTMAYDNMKDTERQRTQLAREIHDELGSILTATKMDIAWINKMLKGDFPEVGDRLSKTSRNLDQGIHFKRQIVQDLHPPMLASFGFWPAIETLIEEYTERNEWNMKVNMPETEPKLDETVGLVAYRIIQETLNNATKYAKATEVSLDIMLDQDIMKIEIQDNGIGFDEALLNHETHGLEGMRNRTMAVRGKYKVSSRPNHGVYTLVLLPVHKDAANAANSLMA